ncbi:hypothetical protein DPMN_081307 [Dreissena polymorpha]|uniref:PDZ domain-containing protein n=1 Tax=Dreissena polymorpha TaxID=45954 RepID=A0A9D3Y4U3_DREPO|nr:hypothetical protein DPMN_081307 [Dreissena polymorpha]
MSFGVRNLPKLEACPVTRWYQLLSEAVGCRTHVTVPTRNKPSLPVLQTMDQRPSQIVEHLVPKVNKVVPSDSRHVISVLRSPYGSFGFSVVDSCPVKVGRVDGASRAEEAGPRPGDLIIRVKGQNVSRVTSVSVSKCIRWECNQHLF